MTRLNVWGGKGLIKRGHWNTDKEGGLHFVKDKWGGDIYHFARKKYTRKWLYPKHVVRFSSLPREKTAIIKLRNFGYSINHLHEALGRSTSWIHKVLKQGLGLGLVHVKDNRKLPRRAVLWASKRKLNSCLFHIKEWTGFICGEEEEPP